MLEWTGERFLPWIQESTIAYEHLHRYAYAATLARDKRVLDLACGEGYGSKILAGTASSVVGVDIDENVVRHAKAKYAAKANLRFVTGSITQIPIPDDHSFDLVICFEAIEHIENQEALLAEVKRLIKPDGALVVSTPNKAIYHDESSAENPFHVKELYFEEFRELLSAHFHNVQFLGQRIHPSSSIWPIGSANDKGFHEFVMDRGSSDFELIETDKRVPLYFIAIASNSPATPSPSGSVLVDESDSLLQEKDRERLKQVAEREATIQSLEGAVKWREGQIQEITEALEWTRHRVTDLETAIGSQQQTISSQKEALAWRAQQVNALEAAKEYWEGATATRAAQLEDTQRDLDQARDTLTKMYDSRGWRFLTKLRGIRDTIKGLVKSRG